MLTRESVAESFVVSYLYDNGTGHDDSVQTVQDLLVTATSPELAAVEAARLKPFVALRHLGHMEPELRELDFEINSLEDHVSRLRESRESIENEEMATHDVCHGCDVAIHKDVTVWADEGGDLNTGMFSKSWCDSCLPEYEDDP